MKIERAQHARMSESGSSLLRLIQNHELPVVDLLVRESIQNSLDASLDSSMGSFVEVHFNVGEFDPTKLGPHLEGITESLDRRFGSASQQYVSIRDYGTVGLTGPMHSDEIRDNDFGNLQKLVYEISKPQQKSGAGGSWGLGKTVYFRVGIGLVLYYSRIWTGSSYESRLAACLVEDEKLTDALLGKSGHLDRGIAWWGQAYGKDSTIPLTDEEEIAEILSIFSLTPYTGDQTGTTIIIPFVSEEALLSDASHNNDQAGSVIRYPWMVSLEEYLKLAIQRWYAPRLHNRSYSLGSYLCAFVNGDPITKNDMMPVFQVIQALYNRTDAAAQNNLDDILSEYGLDCGMEPISLHMVFKHGSKAGQVAFVVLSKRQLKMAPPHNNASPIIHLGKAQSDPDSNPPIMAYTRKPGMIVSYEIVGPWVNRIPHTGPDEFLIGIFVPNKDNELRDEYRGMSLEEYLRGSEQADHMSWTDYAIDSRRPGIIGKIRDQVCRKVANVYRDQPNRSETKHLGGLGRALADILLPPEGFGTRPSIEPSRKKESKPNPRRKQRLTLDIVDRPSFNRGAVHVPFVLSFGRTTTEVILAVVAQTEGSTLKPDDWEDPDEIGTDFPIRLLGLGIHKIVTGKRQRPFEPSDFGITRDSSELVQCKNVGLSLVSSRRGRVPFGVRITVPENTGYSLHGVMKMQSTDTLVHAGLAIIDRKDLSS